MSNLVLKIMALQRWQRLLAALSAGALAAAALPPLGVWPALFVSLPVVVWLLDGVFRQSDRMMDRAMPAFLTGWSFGFGYFGVSLYWIGEAFLVDADVFAWLMPLAVTALPAGLALFWGLAATLSIALWSGGAGRILVFAASFAALEWLRGHVLTGFPWNAPAYAADAVLPVAQSASLFGLYGLTFLVLSWAAAPAALINVTSKRKDLTFLLAIQASLIACFAYGTWRLGQSSKTSQTGTNLRIVQPNIAQKDKWQPDNRRWIYQRYLEMTKGSSGAPAPDVVIWPESALPAYLEEQDGARKQIAETAGKGVVTILGSLHRGPVSSTARVFNSVLILDDKGDIVGRYDKQKLVPFGEYLPLAGLLEPLGLRKLVAMPAGFAAGSGPQTMRIDGIPSFGPLICYEAIFPRALIDRTDRPQWLLNVTNDAWFGESLGPYQHLAQARLRAIEEGLPLVRAANTGISAVIDPLGRIRHKLTLGQRGVLDAALPPPITATPYGSYGDWLFLCMIGLVAFGRVRTFLWNID